MIIVLSRIQRPSSVLTSPAVNAQKPNILVFIADDAGMDFGCYGAGKVFSEIDFHAVYPGFIGPVSRISAKCANGLYVRFM